MHNQLRRGRVYPNAKQPDASPWKIAAAIACIPVIYALWLQFFVPIRHRFYVHPSAFILFIFIISMPNVLLVVCVAVAGKRTAWACISSLAFFVAMNCWLFSLGAAPIGPVLSFFELMLGAILLPIAIGTGDRRTGL